MMPMDVSEAAAGDQTLEMSPLDLFDSIFWGEYYSFPFEHTSDNFQISTQ